MLGCRPFDTICLDPSRSQPTRSVIYICIPTHNEAATIGVLLWKTRNVLGEFGRDYRLVVHDDASSDETAEVLQRYRRSLPLTVLTSDRRIGYGRSVERLLRHVRDEAAYPKRDCAVVMQGDFTETPDDVVSLVKVLEGGADIVAGAVDEEDEGSGRDFQRARWAARKFLHRIVGNYFARNSRVLLALHPNPPVHQRHLEASGSPTPSLGTSGAFPLGNRQSISTWHVGRKYRERQ